MGFCAKVMLQVQTQQAYAGASAILMLCYYGNIHPENIRKVSRGHLQQHPVPGEVAGCRRACEGSSQVVAGACSHCTVALLMFD
jgi:hypothetical protein